MREESCSKTWPARACPRSSPSMTRSAPWFLIRTLKVSSTKRRFSSWFPKRVRRPCSGTETRVIRWSRSRLAQGSRSLTDGEEAEVPELVLPDRRGRSRHQVGGARGLGERDHLPQGGLPGEKHRHPVDAEGDAAV